MAPYRLGHRKVNSLVAAICLILNANILYAKNLTFNDFSSTQLLAVEGAADIASTQDGMIMRLTSPEPNNFGSVYHIDPLNVTQFSVYFAFRVTGSGGITNDENSHGGGHGIVFTIQADDQGFGKGAIGGGMGYEGIDKSIGIEFDTWADPENNDPNDNHVAIDIDGDVSHSVEADQVKPVIPYVMADGMVTHVWIDYDGSNVQIRLSKTDQKPVDTVLSFKLNVTDLLGTNRGFIGFTAATGGAYSAHDVLKWTWKEKAIVYPFEQMWPDTQQPWYFLWPEGMAIGGDGNVYVADYGHTSIQKISPTGSVISRWKVSKGRDQSGAPVKLAVDKDGRSYVFVAGGHLWEFDAGGEFVDELGGPGIDFVELGDGVNSAVVDESGVLYMTDRVNHKIHKLSADRTRDQSWGGIGDSNRMFNEPSGLALDGKGYLYIADRGNRRVQKLTTSGDFVTSWRTKAFGANYGGPYDIAADGQGYVYIIDPDFYRVEKYDAEGRFETQWGALGTSPGEFSERITDIEVDKDGRIYVLGQNNCRVQMFDEEGRFLSKWGVAGDEEGRFLFPGGLSEDLYGRIYVVDSENYRIQRFASDGKYLDEWGQKGDADGEFSKPPRNIAIDRSGVVYVTEEDIIQKFDLNGNFIAKRHIDAPGSLRGIAVDALGFVYVVDAGNSQVLKFLPTLDTTASWGEEGTGPGQFNDPGNIAVDKSGFLYVSDYFETPTNRNRVQKFTTEGVLVDWELMENGSPYPIYSGGLAVDSAGNVYATDRYQNKICKFTPEGEILATWGQIGNAPGEFDFSGGSGSGIWVSRQGKIYVSDTGNHRIQVFNTNIEPDEIDQTAKAIIIAGGGPYPGNALWEATQLNANFAFRALLNQGYTKKTIYYLSALANLDIDGNGLQDDVDADATLGNVENAIKTWARDAGKVFVYLVGHGANGVFKLSPTEDLKATTFDAWIDDLQGAISEDVGVVYDACNAGSFLSHLIPPAGKRRMVITGASENQESLFSSQGTISFSYFLWGRLFNGDSMRNAFTNAKNSVVLAYPDRQLPQLDANGNGIANEKEDLYLADEFEFTKETVSASGFPIIGSISPDWTLFGESSALIRAENVTAGSGEVNRVWAVITPPGYGADSPDIPITRLPSISLEPVGNAVFEGVYRGFAHVGVYNVAVFASNMSGVVSLLTQENRTTVRQMTPAIKGDVNGDGGVTVADAIAMLKALAGWDDQSMIREDYASSGADVDGDSRLGMRDAIYVLREIAY